MTRNSLAVLRRVILVLAVLWFGATTNAAKAETDPLRPHGRVRLSVATPELIRVLSGSSPSAKELRRGRFIGTLQGRRDDDVVIRVRSPESELAIPVRSVTRLEASLGKHGRAGRGALIGFGGGLVGGIAAGLIVCSGGNCETSGFQGETAVVSVVLGLGGAIVGTGVGALTGALIRSERWHTISIQDLPYGEGLSPENGIRLGLTLPLWNRGLVAGTEGY